jgi:hypothetical protein
MVFGMAGWPIGDRDWQIVYPAGAKRTIRDQPFPAHCSFVWIGNIATLERSCGKSMELISQKIEKAHPNKPGPASVGMAQTGEMGKWPASVATGEMLFCKLMG